MAAFYKEHLTDTGENSRAAVSTIEACFTVYEKVFRSDSLRSFIIQLERDVLGSNLTVLKLLDLTVKCKHSAEKALLAYEEATNVARKNLAVTHPICLGLALDHFSVYQPAAVQAYTPPKVRDASSLLVRRYLGPKSLVKGSGAPQS